MMRVWRRLSVMMLLLGVVISVAATAIGRVLPDEGQLLYTTRLISNDVLLHGFDVSRRLSVRLIDRLTLDTPVLPSPDGQQIAFIRRVDVTTNELHVMNSDGSNVREFTGVTVSRAMGWQPDSQHLLVNIEQEIVVLNVFDPSQHIYTGIAINGLLTGVSPDGRYAAFVAAPENGVTCGTAVVDWQTADRYCLPTMGTPLWSNDNRTMIFAASGAIMRYDDWTNENAEGQFLADINPLSDVALSPDGRWLLAVGDSTFDIFLMDVTADPVTPINLTYTTSIREQSLRWSPDGRQVVYVNSDRVRWTDIYMMDADGTHVQRLTDNRQSELNVIWLP